jgi:hypothetical protein
MKTTSNANAPDSDDAVAQELLRSADRHEVELPGEVVERVRAKLHEHTVRSSITVPGRRAARWVKRAWFAAAGAAAAVVVAIVLSLPSSGVAWSQVAEAVRAVPWIHIKVAGPEGDVREIWFSLSRNVVASRGIECGATQISYDDLRAGVRHCYDSEKKKLYRLSVSSSSAKELDDMAGFFQTIFRGDAFRPEDVPAPGLISQRQRTVTEDGRRWILYELQLSGHGRSDSMVIRVDPQTKLPERMTGTHGKDKMEATFDYPVEDLADIYAFGVPRDASIEDRTPPADLSRILKIVEQNRRNFGDYVAVVYGNKEGRPNVVHLVRCKGDKWRIDTGVGCTKHIASGADLATWWQEHGPETLPEGMALCDGRDVYDYSQVHDKTGWQSRMHHCRPGDERAESQRLIGADYFVELAAYPPNKFVTASPDYTVRLDPKGENGPAGSVRVETRMAKHGGAAFRNMYHKEEFWLQPKYGYAVVKHVLSDCPARDEDPRQMPKRWVYEYGGFCRTPRGAWYPAVARCKNALQSKSKNKPRGVEFHDQVTYFHLDFTSQMPDALFTTAWQGDPLVGVCFAPQDDKPTANDFGGIRPPGGPPLNPGGPGTAITVESTERARRRLEAAPANQLDQWVVELEWITGKRLKEWSERQGCRTYFVQRMSVAFDGLKWDAKSAAMLFRRAESLPASEASAWLEALETVLGKKIDRAYTVPLVLIPVDAFYEEHKYSAERAKKYLARLKQLTADDVSLWQDKADQWGGTKLDAAMNIVLLDDYFDKETFQRDKFKAAILGKRP